MHIKIDEHICSYNSEIPFECLAEDFKTEVVKYINDNKEYLEENVSISIDGYHGKQKVLKLKATKVKEEVIIVNRNKAAC
ncbi:hypothetical protein [uncultured Cetobacterium sp.]|uniref:hypothetical protein n=1 Tax=uncultured Cetobacterium sp. TaxID=527638 RepID=UPI002632B535|nr:hypothetical protein [uncultured Cetobacterium sp.]